MSRPLHLSLGSFGSVDAIVAAVAFDDTGLHAEVGAALTLRLGPLGVSVDHVGVGATATFPSSGGNLGLADLEVNALDPAVGLWLPNVVLGTLGLVLFRRAAREQTLVAPRWVDRLATPLRHRFAALGLLETHGAGGGPASHS
jgi:hypothetical protein